MKKFSSIVFAVIAIGQYNTQTFQTNSSIQIDGHYYITYNNI